MSATPIHLADYDPDWPHRFELHRQRLLAALNNRALSIEHMGSTAVPNLLAKPVIDIVLVVADSAAESQYLPALEQAGYHLRIREPDWHEHRMFNTPERDVNLHVFSTGCEEVAHMRAFRDHLRADPADRELYALAKRDLAAQPWEDIQNYADAKTEIVRSILQRAQPGRGATAPTSCDNQPL